MEVTIRFRFEGWGGQPPGLAVRSRFLSDCTHFFPFAGWASGVSGSSDVASKEESTWDAPETGYGIFLPGV